MGVTYNPFTLEGKTILVTGASSGIGKATAIECAKMGAKLVITGRNEARLNEVYNSLEGEGHIQVIADLSNDEEIQRLVDEIPVLNGCVNNAGYNVMSVIPFIKKDELGRIMNVNLTAPIMLTHLLVKKKKIAKDSSIVFTSSISARGRNSVGNSMYSATKGGLSSFMKNAALELAAKRIRCNAVLPGMVETPLKEGKANVTEEQWEINRQLYPLKRFGKPEEIAYGIIYLLSDASAWVTGTELVIDGGMTR
ncbi:SDR family oxidoreductase [uncultured Prevotella sp.]|uniref:SDR family NAD(P)-dependent oxidoreductase n=1 Tax=uncultured Prevotella sp. TaxID=159272 RepID=UPI0025F5B185|nr:SDR family oxidoreductase [uncultured Prevotella sp.]